MGTPGRAVRGTRRAQALQEGVAQAVPTTPASVYTVTTSQLRLLARTDIPLADQTMWGGGAACIRWQRMSLIFMSATAASRRLAHQRQQVSKCCWRCRDGMAQLKAETSADGHVRLPHRTGPPRFLRRLQHLFCHRQKRWVFDARTARGDTLKASPVPIERSEVTA